MSHNAAPAVEGERTVTETAETKQENSVKKTLHQQRSELFSTVTSLPRVNNNYSPTPHTLASVLFLNFFRN